MNMCEKCEKLGIRMDLAALALAHGCSAKTAVARTFGVVHVEVLADWRAVTWPVVGLCSINFSVDAKGEI
jgi:hypothetical protein